MPTGIPAVDIAQAALGAANVVSGFINKGKTKTEAERLARTRPQYEISPLAGEDLSLAKSDLANGMSAGASKAYDDLNNGQFSSSLGAILKGGGDVNSIGELYGNNQEGRLRLSMMKDELRLNQINNVVRASEAVQKEQQTKWQLDKFAPWQDKAQANAAAREGAQKQISDGFNSFGAAVGNFGQKKNEDNQLLKTANLNDFTDYNSDGFATGIPNTGFSAPTIQGTNILS